ncbi:hypothetical protein NPS01_15610 [Nocardioides psychrotolerans]|uniref:Uncharacterized conserved protein, DUF952 family n=1 Tax=Nocardioides psychrotolerans TaxID=1005945 RepID=A0A1I3F1C7_9ACTN|nr:DUF952 domain-containing protein [Nocardioides psychrotolerans]GEP37898.1 hypothetical protein NPS01_15610 [Nocardioides psychrotolerans]SFI05075.1 Uncharacterized conserved protein, DUF952 family [Nocardioides psychrotolerans]
MRIFHIATVADWEAARTSGAYTTSTIGRTLAEEGFLHASRGDQWQGVRERFYADVTDPLLLLVIETDRLTVPMVEEPVADSAETFPHIYGALSPDAVVRTIPLDGRPLPEQTFSQVFLGEVLRRVVLALLVMGIAVVGALVGSAVEPTLGASVGLLVGLVVGVGVALVVHRRR